MKRFGGTSMGMGMSWTLGSLGFPSLGEYYRTPGVFSVSGVQQMRPVSITDFIQCSRLGSKCVGCHLFCCTVLGTGCGVPETQILVTY